MPIVKMYTSHWCGYCHAAERLLQYKGVTDIEKIYVDVQDESREEMTELTGRRSVPQLFIGDQHIGGYHDLATLEQEGELDGLLGTSSQP